MYIYDTESYTTNNNLSENKFDELETKYNNIICQKVRKIKMMTNVRKKEKKKRFVSIFLISKMSVNIEKITKFWNCVRKNK